MAKNVVKRVAKTKDELKKLPRSEQRRYLDLGLVKGVEPPAVAAAEADAKAKAK